MTGTLYNLKSGQITVADASETTADATDLNQVDGITAGTVTASKAVVVDANKDALGFRSISGTGTASFNTIAEKTAANGVVVDGVTLKDGGLLSAGNAAYITTGTFASADVGGTVLSASRTAAVRHYADDGNSAIAAGNSVRTTVNRFLILANDAGDVSICAAQNQVKIGTATPGATANVSGAWDYLEVGAAATIPGYYSAARAHVDCGSNNVTVAASSLMAGLAAYCTFNGTITETGVCAALYVGKSPAGSTNTWPQALYIASAGMFAKFESGTAYASGAKVGSITSVGGDSGVTADGVLKINVAGTVYYIPFFAAGSVTGE